jgi:hypothetical protein
MHVWWLNVYVGGVECVTRCTSRTTSTAAIKCSCRCKTGALCS